MSTSVTVRHTFEAGHRLPHIPGKCQSLHGHTWHVAVTVTDPNSSDLIVQFGHLKGSLRQWIDDRLDHGLMLGEADPLREYLSEHGKVFTISPWPSVEAVAMVIAEIARGTLASIEHAPGAYVSEVTVSETPVNDATWRAQ